MPSTNALAADAADLDDLIGSPRRGRRARFACRGVRPSRLERRRDPAGATGGVRGSFSGTYDAGDAVMTVNAGEGGTDAQDWAEMFLRMCMRWAESRGFEADIEAIPGEEAGHQDVTFTITGPSAYGLFQAERGWSTVAARLSPFDSAHRRQTRSPGSRVAPRRRATTGGRDRREGP